MCIALVRLPAATPQRRSIGLCEATAWLHAHRGGGSPAVGRPTGVSAASWHALASLHKAGSGGSGGSTTGTDNGVKAASAPAILVRACSTLVVGLPAANLQCAHRLPQLADCCLMWHRAA